jgi:hypothetical protein
MAIANCLKRTLINPMLIVCCACAEVASMASELQARIVWVPQYAMAPYVGSIDSRSPP